MKYFKVVSEITFRVDFFEFYFVFCMNPDLKLQLPFEKTQDIYSRLHFRHKSSVVPHSDNEFCTSLFTIMHNDYVLLRL